MTAAPERPDQAFPEHVFAALGVDPTIMSDRIGGMVMVAVKRPADGPVTVMTAGASKLPTDTGERVELAVEVADGQEGAAVAALTIVCDDMAQNHRVPPVGVPWRNSEPFLTGTAISAIMVTPSRWGPTFDDVRDLEGEVVGHVRTLRLLTDEEAGFAAANGWDALVERAGSIDALLDVERASAVDLVGVPDNAPVFVTKLHAENPPHWVTFTGSELQSVTGLESDDYMADPDNVEIWSASSFAARFPRVAGFLGVARAGQTALFVDGSGDYTLEDD